MPDSTLEDLEIQLTHVANEYDHTSKTCFARRWTRSPALLGVAISGVTPNAELYTLYLYFIPNRDHPYARLTWGPGDEREREKMLTSPWMKGAWTRKWAYALHSQVREITHTDPEDIPDADIQPTEARA